MTEDEILVSFIDEKGWLNELGKKFLARMLGLLPKIHQGKWVLLMFR